MSKQRLLLLAGIAVPVLYFSSVFVSPLAYPGYSHTTQYASELGMAGTHSAPWFNSGIFLAGLAMLAGSAGIYGAARSEGAQRWSSALGSALLALFGVGILFGAMFPMPDPRHGGFGLGMGIHLAPFLLALAFRRVEGRRRLTQYLTITGALMLGLFLPMMGVGGLVTTANVGLFQRVYALTIFAWIGVASYVLAQSTEN